MELNTLHVYIYVFILYRFLHKNIWYQGFLLNNFQTDLHKGFPYISQCYKNGVLCYA